MPLTATSNRMPCPNCAYSAEFPYEMKEIVTLSQPYSGPDGDPKTASPIWREKLPCCRRCGYIIGLADDDDEVQQAAEAYGREVTSITEPEPAKKKS